MKRFIEWIWSRGIVSTFLSGLFAVLPIVITAAIISWVASQLHALVGPETAFGRTLQSVGLRFVADERAAFVVGLAVVLAGIWLLGLLVKSKARTFLENFVNGIVNRIPLVKGIYGTAARVVDVLRRDEQAELKAMGVVYCSFGEQHGAGFLALLSTSETFRFGGRDCHVVYLPTSPLPMTGGIIFVPVDNVTRIDMAADDLMQIYFSLGMLTSQAVPKRHRGAVDSGPATPS